MEYITFGLIRFSHSGLIVLENETEQCGSFTSVGIDHETARIV